MCYAVNAVEPVHANRCGRLQLKSFYSVDRAIIEEGADQVEAHHSTEYLNSINVSGIPLTGFKPNVRCPVMILQNLGPAIALCNGAQAIHIYMLQHMYLKYILFKDIMLERQLLFHIYLYHPQLKQLAFTFQIINFLSDWHLQ